MPPGRRPAAAGCMPEHLLDPLEDRPVKEVPLPPRELLTLENYWESPGVPNIDVLVAHLNLEGALTQELLLDIIKKAQEIFEAEPNLLKLNDPITVVGDLHGQYYDVVKLLEVGGKPGDTQYIFLGDYVDRGSFSVEVIETMYTLKILHPKRIRMLRGNHECRQMTSFFNFREECEYKYDTAVYDAIMDSFDHLPVAATINGKFLAVHGGLSPELLNLKAINRLNRFQETPKEGLLCDLMWADPLEDDAEAAQPKKGGKGPAFIPNQVRGCSYYFSFDGAQKFLTKNSLLSVIRAHEVQIEGYKMHKMNPSTGFPSVITIFSAPNYCDVYNNKGAILKFDNSTLNILQFNCSPHPYHLPNFMDVFTWSMPFVIEKVTEMLFYILQPTADEEAKDDIKEEDLPALPATLDTSARASLSVEQNEAVELATRLGVLVASGSGGGAHTELSPEAADARDRMRKKVRTIARMARMFKTLRQENETVIRLKGVCPGHKLAPGLLLEGKERLNTELELFGHVQNIDLDNEKRPEGEKLMTSTMTSPRDFNPEDEADQADQDDDAEQKDAGSAGKPSVSVNA